MSNNKSYAEQMDDVVKRILNRDKFEFDLNGDALYNQYKDAYVQQAKMAKEDAIGKASAMTGGYGNSYAQSVGQQMYQNEMNNLNDMAPELYQMALDRYNQEGQNLFDQYSVLQPLAEHELEQADEYEYIMKQLDKYTPYKPKSGGIQTGETEATGKDKEADDDGDVRVDVNSDLNYLISNGASRSEVNEYLRLALENGLISSTEYQALKNKFAPKGNQY
jgi:hypothetical protein